MPLFDFQTPAKIHDHRGVQVQLWSHRGAPGHDENEHERELAARVAFLAAQHTRRAFLVMGVVFPAALVLVTCSGLSSEVGIAIVCVVLVGALFLMRPALQRVTGPIIRDALLSDARCPSCAYDLRRLTPESDRCTVCPECHSAWMVDPGAIQARDARDALYRPPVTPDETSDDRAFGARLRAFFSALGFRRHYAELDARGRMVALIDPSPLGRRPPRWNDVALQRRTSIRLRLWLIGWQWRVLITLCLLPSMIFTWPLALARVLPSLSSSPLVWIGLASQLLWMPLFLILIILHPFTRTGRPIVQIMLGEAHCPSCAASLVGTPRQPGDVYECPACKASWLIPPAQT